MKQKILLVDDDLADRTILRRILEIEDRFAVTEAVDGKQALELLAERLNPDLCILDLRMPNVDGSEFLRRIRRDPELSALKVVIASANRDREAIVALAQFRISGYLLKPYDTERTLTLVKQVMPRADRVDPANVSRNLLFKTLLVAEDDALMRQFITTIAKAERDWEVVEASDGQEAFDRLLAGLRPHLCLVDLRMPKLDGFQFIAQVRQDSALANIKIVVISGETDREKIRGLAQFGVSGYLLKPVAPEKIIGLLRSSSLQTPQ
jgi:two-component system chemotaxis response regulator CheY